MTTAATSLLCSPFKSVSKCDRKSYGKRKSRQLGNAAKSVCAEALNLSVADISSTDNDTDRESQNDLAKLMV